MASESNALAASNGYEMENIIKALYPGAHFEYKGVIDFTINGVRVELKSCQDCVIDASHSSGFRSGRFVFSDLQHKILIENNGDYIFLVQHGGIPVFYARVPARKVKLGKFSSTKAVCWKTVIRGAV